MGNLGLGFSYELNKALLIWNKSYSNLKLLTSTKQLYKRDHTRLFQAQYFLGLEHDLKQGKTLIQSLNW